MDKQISELLSYAAEKYKQSELTENLNIIISTRQYFELQLNYGFWSNLRRKYFGYTVKEVDLLFEIIENIGFENENNTNKNI